MRWFKDGAEIRPDNSKVTVETTPTGVMIKIPDTSVKDAGRYTCTVSNVAGTATTTGNLIVRGLFSLLMNINIKQTSCFLKLNFNFILHLTMKGICEKQAILI